MVISKEILGYFSWGVVGGGVPGFDHIFFLVHSLKMSSKQKTDRNFEGFMILG